MLAFSRLVFGFLNVLALAFSIFQIVFAIIENHGSGGYKSCNRKTAWLILWLSVFLLIMSLIGLFASCLRSRVLQSIYLAVAAVVTLVAVVITVFTFAALPKSSADATRQKALDKNWLHQFSPLLRETLVNDDDWLTIKDCLIDIKLCDTFKSHSDSQPGPDQNFLRLGCCVPPERCGFVQENGTYKESPKSTAAAAWDRECRNWSKKLLGGECYDCDSCKAGYLAQFQSDWRADGGIFIGIAVSLVVVTFLSLYILRIQATAKDYLDQKQHERIYPRTPSNEHSIREFSISCPEVEEEEEEKHSRGMLGRIPMEPFVRGNDKVIT